MGERSLAELAATPLQQLPFRSPLPVAMHRVLLLERFIGPLPVGVALRFGDIRPEVERLTLLQTVRRVIPLSAAISSMSCSAWKMDVFLVRRSGTNSPQFVKRVKPTSTIANVSSF